MQRTIFILCINGINILKKILAFNFGARLVSVLIAFGSYFQLPFSPIFFAHPKIALNKRVRADNNGCAKVLAHMYCLSNTNLTTVYQDYSLCQIEVFLCLDKIILKNNL